MLRTRSLAGWLVSWFDRFSITGLSLGTLLLAFSLTPSLVPRTPLVQGLLAGVSMSAGYLLAWIARQLWSYLELPVPDGRWHHRALVVVSSVCVAIAALFFWRASDWQNSVRQIMGLAPVESVRPLTVGLITLVVFLLLVTIGRAFRRTARLLSRWLKPWVPRRVAYAVGTAVAVVLFWSLTKGLVFSQLLRTADASYAQVDALIPDDMAAPQDAMRTGSAASLVAWKDLGRQGRAFVAGGGGAAEIGAFTGRPALAPRRVYVGLNAASDPVERARLALEELIRVDGFSRSLLVLITPTGTGWVDPASVSPLEYLHHGDIASVAVQYSYLPSPLALIADDAYGAETARALFEAVYGHWSQLPADARPRLFLHGVSLGALNSERSFHLHDVLAAPFDGALWVGMPFRSAPWNAIVAGRDPASPYWLPRYRDGGVVRFMNQTTQFGDVNGPWGPLRMAYLQYASDPITFFSLASTWREPAWMKAPRGPDVSPALRWYPVVTMLQLAADMAAGAPAAPSSPPDPHDVPAAARRPRRPPHARTAACASRQAARGDRRRGARRARTGHRAAAARAVRGADDHLAHRARAGPSVRLQHGRVRRAGRG
jgi:uncharacterized membrane protein